MGWRNRSIPMTSEPQEPDQYKITPQEFYRVMARLSIIQIFANAVGGLACAVYFIFLDPSANDFERATDMIVAIVMILCLMVIGSGGTLSWLRELRDAGKALSRGLAVDPDLLARAQKKTLQAPLALALISLANWTLAALTMTFYSLFFFTSVNRPFAEDLRLFWGIFLPGLALGSVLFFYLDRSFRGLRPMFFPNGGLLAVKGVFRINVSRRLLFSFMAAGLLPMIIIGVLLLSKFASMLSSLPPALVVRFTTALIILPTAMIALSILLSRLASASISEPIAVLKSAMGRIRKGDLSARALVRDNDELGELAENFNLMIEGLRERARLQEGLNLAKEVQQSLLPHKAPEVTGLDLAGRGLYCDETGGDYIDFIEIDPQNPGLLGVVVGDVSGHGVQSALLMTSVRAALRTRIVLGGQVKRIISDVNHLACRDVEESCQFITLFYGLIDADNKNMTWTNAGHEPAMVYDPVSDSFHELKDGSPALGVMEDFSYQEQVVDLPPGVVVLIGTDGIWETRNRDGRMFGKQAVRRLIRENAAAPAAEIMETIIHAVDVFRGGAPREDDLTIMIVKAVE